jgi:hypothetical protein
MKNFILKKTRTWESPTKRGAKQPTESITLTNKTFHGPIVASPNICTNFSTNYLIPSQVLLKHLKAKLNQHPPGHHEGWMVKG